MARKKMIISIKKRRATDSSLFVIPCFVFDFMVTNIVLVRTVDTNVNTIIRNKSNIVILKLIIIFTTTLFKILGLCLVEFGVEVVVGH